MTTNAPQNGKAIGLETSVSKAFMAQALGVAFDRPYYFDPLLRHSIDQRCQEYLDRTHPALNALFTESNLGRKPFVHPSQVLVGGIQPNMILGMLLGAAFVPSPAGDADITPACWAGKPIGDLPSPGDLTTHPLIREFDQQIRSIQEEGRLQPVPPFFWDSSGRAAIHGPLTTAQKFLGEEVFLDMLTDPARVHQMMDWIAEASISLVRHYANLCGIQIRAVHVGECSSCMVGAREWESFVIPRLNQIGAALGPVRLHSCGQSGHILEPARKIDRLHALDLGGETSLRRVRELHGTDLPVSMAPPVKLLAAGSLAGLQEWSLKVAEDNGRGSLTIVHHLEPQYPLPAILAWHAWLKDSTSDFSLNTPPLKGEPGEFLVPQRENL